MTSFDETKDGFGRQGEFAAPEAPALSAPHDTDDRAAVAERGRRAASLSCRRHANKKLQATALGTGITVSQCSVDGCKIVSVVHRGRSWQGELPTASRVTAASVRASGGIFLVTSHADDARKHHLLASREHESALRIIAAFDASEVCSVTELDDGSACIAQRDEHIVTTFWPQGRQGWVFGTKGRPERGPRHLAGPCAVVAVNGGVAIADELNHRIVLLDLQGRFVADVDRVVTPSAVVPLRLPRALHRRGGHVLVDLGGHDGMARLDLRRRTCHVVSGRMPTDGDFAYPRSAAVTHNGLWVADTHNDRVMLVRPTTTASAFDDIRAIHVRWPRCVRTVGATLVVCSGLAGDVLRIHPTTGSVSAISGFADPHDARPTADGGLLVTDSQAEEIVEVRPDGRVRRRIGIEHGIVLSDPHQACELGDGSLTIADSGHHRLVRLDRRGRPLAIEAYDYPRVVTQVGAALLVGDRSGVHVARAGPKALHSLVNGHVLDGQVASLQPRTRIRLDRVRDIVRFGTRLVAVATEQHSLVFFDPLSRRGGSTC